MREVAQRLVAVRTESAGRDIRRLIDVDRLIDDIASALTTAHAAGRHAMCEEAAKLCDEAGASRTYPEARRTAAVLAAAIRAVEG